MKIKSLFLAILAGLISFVSCTEGLLGDPSVKLLSDPVIEADMEGATVEIVFTSTTAWELKDIDKYADWLTASPVSGKGSSDKQTVTVTISPNQEADRTAYVNIYAAAFAQTTVTINQPGEKGDGVEAKTVADFLAEKNTTQSYKLTGKIGDIATGSKYYGFTLKDETGEISCPFPSNWDSYSSQLHTGATVSVVGPYSFYESKNQDQVKNAEIVAHTPADASSIETVTVAQMLQKADKFNRYRLSGTVAGTVDEQHCSFDLKDETGTIKVWTVNNAGEWGSVVKTGGKVTLIGAYTLYNNTTSEIVDADIENFEAGSSTEEPGADPVGDGTKASPYNVAKALQVAKTLAADGYTETEVYLEGIVSDMGTGIDLGYGNATFYISDDGSTSNQLYIYRLLDVDGAKFTDVNRFKKGDKLLMYGKLQNYKGNTPELAQGSQLVSVNGSETIPDYLNVSATTLSVKSAAGSTNFTISSNVKWTVSSNNAEFSVSPANGEGNAEVTISYTENKTPAERTASITVVAGDISKTVTVTQSVAGSAEDNTVVAEQGKDYLAANQNGKLDDVISYTNSSTYTAGTSITELRIYKDATLKITAAEGYSIAYIELTCTAGANVKYGYYESYVPTLDSGATASTTVDGKVATISIDGTTSSFAVVASQNQIRITNMKVAYFKK